MNKFVIRPSLNQSVCLIDLVSVRMRSQRLILYDGSKIRSSSKLEFSFWDLNLLNFNLALSQLGLYLHEGSASEDYENGIDGQAIAN